MNGDRGKGRAIDERIIYWIIWQTKAHSGKGRQLFYTPKPIEANGGNYEHR